MSSTPIASAAEAASAGLPVGSLLTVTPHPISKIPTNLSVIRTAGCLIIGDEVLNGKTKDTNSQYLAKLVREFSPLGTIADN